ncbi:uncharacterized protein LOC128868400 isoform X1 [Anastrepha ludens]|uniref:uncharacterized protein LOC128868400 isoform X1 n=1 Tax=Anastrepha ludens TaxID=28586 RepID=UPI0023AF174E|nr:uncharacterized protein LOC128868400 isoform X1 [Anastrepha ludens]
MSHNIAISLAIIASIVTICTSLPDYHKQMSPTQLQSVFHVDSVNAVPHYEVVQLLHHSFDDGVATASLPEHYRRRRRRSINSVALDTDARATLKEPHHVKKDLSKNPYYSELKAAANAPGAGGVNSLEQATRGKFPSDLRELKEHKVSFNAFGENLNLTLKRTDSLFKGGSPHTLRMWTVRDEANATHGLDMEEVYDEDAQSSDQIGQVYQDETNMAAILMRRHLETGDLIMEGSIGHEMVIKPLPHELSPNPDAAHHVVYKREAQPLEHLSDFAFMEPDDLDISEKLERRQRRSAPFDGDEASLEELDDEMETLSAEATNTRNKRQVPYIIYPEVLVIIDYDGYRLHGGDNLQVKRYFISFWNGVDLRYRLLKGPRIRISIAGIIISRGRDATPYLERNRVGRDAIDSAAALTDMGKYLFRERRLPVYDIAVAITKLDMCRRTTAHGECNRGTAGFAYVGGACVVNKRLEKVNSVAIIEDTGGFSGIIVAAHEVGHLLGAVHDGSPPPSYLGGPGAQRCRWEDGYIMSDLRHTERGFRWSPCTIQSFHHFLNGDTATCLHNAPHEDSALGRALPGTLLSLDAQCRRDRGTYACFKDERVCAQLFCFDAQTGYCVAYRPAAEGSTCGTGLQCLDGRCTPLTSNVIPAYRSYNNTVSAAAKLQQHATLHNNNDNNNEDDVDDTEDNVDDANVDADDDESNEAIDDKQQKRKFQTGTTVSANAQQQEHTQRLQKAPPPLAPTRSSSSNDGSGGINSSSNNKALQRPATFIDAYLKKLQALNTPTDVTATLTATTTGTTVSTSSVIGSNGKAVATGTHESETEKRAQPETFGSHFLKRTQNSNSRSSSGNGSVGSGSNSNSNHNHGNSSSNNKNNNQNRNHKKLTRISSHNDAATLKPQQNEYDNVSENEQAEQVVRGANNGELRIATTTQQPAYVTNYIGDNTNNLPRLLEQQQQRQQEQQSSSTKTTSTTTSSQPNQQSQQQQQKAHKVKTQKLIRRQLLRTQIK